MRLLAPIHKALQKVALKIRLRGEYEDMLYVERYSSLGGAFSEFRDRVTTRHIAAGLTEEEALAVRKKVFS